MTTPDDQKARLEQEFHQEAVAGCLELRRNHGYNPTYFLQMVNAHRAVNATKILLKAKDAQTGLNSLWEVGRLDLSSEAAVLNPKYASLFTAEEKREAKKRLKAVNYEPKFG